MTTDRQIAQITTNHCYAMHVFNTAIRSSHIHKRYDFASNLHEKMANGKNQSLVLRYCACEVITTYFDR